MSLNDVLMSTGCKQMAIILVAIGNGLWLVYKT